MRVRHGIGFYIFKYVVIILMLCFIFYPVFIVIISSFKSSPEILNNVFSLLGKIGFENYARAWVEGTLYMFYGNSIIITFISVVLITLFASFLAFAISREDFIIKKLIYFVFIIGIAVPSQVGIIPEYLLMARLNILNTRIGLILVYVAYGLPFAVFIMYNFFRKIPKEIQESAVVDGCGNFRMYYNIIMPLSPSVITTVIIFSLVWVWNDMFFPLILIKSRELKTLPSGLLGFRGEFTTDFSTMFAGVVLVSIPITVAYLLLQKKFVEGMTAGAIKG